MAGKGFGIVGSKLKLQPGATISEQQDYSLRGRAVFAGDVSLLDTKPKRGDSHPKADHVLCYATETTWKNINTIEVSADYIGLDADPTPYFLEFVGSVGEEAIETHPNFASVIGGTPAAPLHGAKFDDETKEFLGFPADAADQLGGVRSYYRPSVIVRVSYWQNDMPNPGALGTIQDPGIVPGLVLPANCSDLLVTNFGYRTLTPLTAPFQITVELLASGPLGWNELIYPHG